MASIPGLIYLVVGLFVAGFSLYLNAQRGAQTLLLFMYAGIALAGWGLLKIIYRAATKEPAKLKESAHHPESLLASYCNKCGSLVRRIDLFCHRCGARLLHRSVT